MTKQIKIYDKKENNDRIRIYFFLFLRVSLVEIYFFDITILNVIYIICALTIYLRDESNISLLF